MTPWIECPSLDLDLSLPLAERFREISEEFDHGSDVESRDEAQEANRLQT